MDYGDFAFHWTQFVINKSLTIASGMPIVHPPPANVYTLSDLVTGFDPTNSTT